MPDIVAIIPARYNSTRFPGKSLADLFGKPLIQHVYERVIKASVVSRVYVATDDKRIALAVEQFGGKAVMTSPHHLSGTDRVAEAAAATGGNIIVNVQGDEPLIEPSVIDAVCTKMMSDSGIVCSTAVTPIRDEVIYHDQHSVKVVIDHDGHALYFSRSPIPFYRDGKFGGAYLHIGIYCFQRHFLELFPTLKQTPLEQSEKLEQLRILEHGYRIGVVVTDYYSIGVDTEKDLENVRKLMGKNKP